MNYTEWFSDDVNPIRKGVYQRNVLGGMGYAYWNGGAWGVSVSNAADAYRYRNTISIFQPGYAMNGQASPWRGILKEGA